jgi:dTDP-4-amino-4,6-dideoxygalactose transaminase
LVQIATQGAFQLPVIPGYATNNAHLFYIVLPSAKERQAILEHLKANGIHAVFHYLSLHKSPFYSNKHDGRELPNCDRFADCLVRLPFFYELQQTEEIIQCILDR